MRAALFAALVLAAPLAGCAEPKPPTIEPVSVKATTLTPKGIDLKVKLDVTNPNGFTMRVRSVSGTLTVGKDGGTKMGTAKIDSKLKIPAESTKRFDSKMSVPWENVAALAPLALSADPVPYSFKGEAKIGSKKLNVDVPFELKGELTKLQLAKVGINSLPKLPDLPSLIP